MPYIIFSKFSAKQQMLPAYPPDKYQAGSRQKLNYKAELNNRYTQKINGTVKIILNEIVTVCNDQL